MKFGEKIRHQRDTHGLTQVQLAAALGVSKRTIKNYEQCRTYPKNREFYKTLADFFKMDVNYFLSEDEEFRMEAAAMYGRRGLTQADAVLEQAFALFAGGELSDDDKMAFLHEIQQIYFDSKERAKKYTPHKYLQPDAPEE